jgi:hypothetical protein
VTQGFLDDPVLVVTGYTAPAAPSVSLNGEALTADLDYALSLDSAAQKLWITFRVPWTGTSNISIAP